MNEQIIKDVTVKIAKFMNITDIISEVEFLNYKKGTSSNYILESLKYHTDYNAIMPVIEKIEDETEYIGFSNKIESGYRCFFVRNNQTQGLIQDGDTYTMSEGHLTRLEAIFLGVGEFLDKYYSQEEKNRRIIEKQAKFKSEIDNELNLIWDHIGCDRPSNADDIVDFVYEDVVELGFENWSNMDVAIGLRRWIEAQQK